VEGKGLMFEKILKRNGEIAAFDRVKID